MDSVKGLLSRVMINPTDVIKETQKALSMSSSYQITSGKSTQSPIPYSQPPPFSQQLLKPSSTDPITQKTAQSTVSCVYQAHIGGFWRNVTVSWCKNLVNHSVTIAVDSAEQDCNSSCKIDLKPWHFWSKKGYKIFEVDENHVEVYWDLRSAKFSGSPEPCSDFYVAMVCDEEVVLLIGDSKKKAYKRTKSRPALFDALMFYKKEHVFNKRCFSTRARFDRMRKEHDIVVESSTFGPGDPEMWITVDGVVLVHVRNLQWKFRGNQTVVVNALPVQVFWDVHAWLFCNPGSGPGLFIFKPGQSEPESDWDERSLGCGGGSSGGGESDFGGGNGRYFTTLGRSRESEFCLFLCAWKID